ncbi:MAG: AEC family transporter [Clostridia bacterium]|nr:AEC family transporter [Clostridia bacterium]
MLEIFLVALNPLLILFFCLSIGFILKKANLLPENASKVMAKLELWVFCPALSFSTMAKNFNIDSIGTHLTNIIISSIAITIAILLAIFLSKFFIKEEVYEKYVYQYALAFGNMGYVGDPIILALFGLEGLAYYKITTLPLSIMVYLWGLNILTPKALKKNNFFGSLINAPIIALLLGMIVGITGLGNLLYTTDNFFTDLLSNLGACMGPVAMILAGVTIGSYNVKKMLTNKKAYFVTLLRLIFIPTFIIALMFGLKELLNLILPLNINNNVLILLLIAFAAPLGLNTVVFPEAFGGDTSTGASMAMISHTLCVITLPIMYALATLMFGPVQIF